MSNILSHSLRLNTCAGRQDVAIAYGYNNVRWTVPPTVTVGKELPLNQLCELLRGECAMAGYTEVRTALGLGANARSRGQRAKAVMSCYEQCGRTGCLPSDVVGRVV